MFEALAHWRRALFHKEDLEEELEEELRFHVEMQTKKNIESGMRPEEARYEALRRFGGVEQIKEECRDVWGVRTIETLWHDVRYGVRMLAKHPGFTTVAVLSLALGIGATSTIFSVLNAAVLRPLPFREPDRLVEIREFDEHADFYVRQG